LTIIGKEEDEEAEDAGRTPGGVVVFDGGIRACT